MSVERQQGGDYQRRFDFEAWEELPRHDAGGNGGTEAAACVESQAFTALTQARALTERRMEEVTERAHLNRAYQRVKANQGAPGIDGMSVEQLGVWIR